MKKPLLILAAVLGCLLAGNLQAFAAHLVGGELSYVCLGGDNHRIELVVYRDCNCVSCADFDDPAHITIFDGEGNFVDVVDMFSPDIVEIPIDTEELCLENAPDVCIQRANYELEISLPASSTGYQLVYQRCCRNNTIANLLDPGAQGSTYVIGVPPAAPGSDCNNSSPQFDNFPPIVICANSPLIFDHSATDADGDSLVYSICEPLLGASTADPYPAQASFPPYQAVEWLAPYGPDNQLASDPPMSVDPVTGLLTAFPNTLGQFVVGICVSEYRDGVLLSTNSRDFQFNVADCAIVEALANIDIGENDTICLGESVQLIGQAFSADSWYWEPPFSLNNSDILNPVATPTTTTTYTLTVVNLAAGCGATAQITIHVVNPITANAGEDQSFCPGQTVQLNGSGGDIYSWSPTDGLSNPNIANPIATPNATTTYTLTVSDASGSCIGIDEMTVSVGSSGDPGDMPDDQVILCDGGTTDLSAAGVELDEGSVLGYVLLTASGEVLGDVLATAATGTFGYNSPMTYNTVYYVSSVVGPPSADGLPDLNNGCTVVAPGTPLVFLSPLQILLNEYCDWQFTGDFTITVGAMGGYPAFDAGGVYTLGGTVFNVGLNAGNTAQEVLNEGMGTHTYTLTLDDGYCPTIENLQTFVCYKNAIELTRFAGKAIATGNELAWTTASETDNSHFVVERASDGLNFVALGKINGAGTTLAEHQYSYLDATAPEGTSYYRLQSVDFNGNSTYSEVIAVERRASAISGVSVLPVPAHDWVQISFDNNNTQNPAALQVFDATGRLVETHSIAGNTYPLSIAHYPTGLYYVAIQTEQGLQTAKMIKK